ncbi:MAG: hypothetical protein WDN31_04680 [Hyphomicrobium sp.]
MSPSRKGQHGQRRERAGRNDACAAGRRSAVRQAGAHFRQIVLWPIQLIAGVGGGESPDVLFERLAGGNWELVDDEFGVEAMPSRSATTASS